MTNVVYHACCTVHHVCCHVLYIMYTLYIMYIVHHVCMSYTSCMLYIMYACPIHHVFSRVNFLSQDFYKSRNIIRDSFFFPKYFSVVPRLEKIAVENTMNSQEKENSCRSKYMGRLYQFGTDRILLTTSAHLFQDYTIFVNEVDIYCMVLVV